MFTDKTIEITCAECDEIITGVDAMTAHILDKHPVYSAVEAVNFARNWAESAHDQAEEFENSHDADRRLDKAIECDAFPNK